MDTLKRKDVARIVNRIHVLARNINRFARAGIMVYPGFEDEILECDKPELSFWYAYYIPGADIISLTNVVMESKDPYYSYLCARDIPQLIPDFDITPFEDSVLELENTKWSEQFLYNVKGSRKELHENVIRNNEAKKFTKRISRTISKLKKSS